MTLVATPCPLGHWASLTTNVTSWVAQSAERKDLNVVVVESTPTVGILLRRPRPSEKNMTARHHQRIKLGCNVSHIVHAEVACEVFTNATLSWLVPNGFVTQVTLIQN